jgi:hypothetical protein
MNLVHNERLKLTATWVSGLATAFIAAGLFAPLAALTYGIAELRVGPLSIVLVIGLCVGVGALLHLLGRLPLRGLRE